MDDSNSTVQTPESQEAFRVKARTHTFDLGVAEVCGVHAAVILYNFRFWIAQNAKKNRNFHDGRYWTYQSMNELIGTFTYLTLNQIRTAIDKLEKGGYIVKGNYNKSSYDRTTWYAITEAGYALFSDYTPTNAVVIKPNSICDKTQMEQGYNPDGEVTEHNSIRGTNALTDTTFTNTVPNIFPPNPPTGGTGESFPVSHESVNSAGTGKGRRQRREQSAPLKSELSPEEEEELSAMSPRLRDAVRDWMADKAQRRNPYTPTSKRALIGMVQRNVGQYGADIVAQTIEESTANGYAGIAWSRAAQMKKAKEDEARAQEERKKELPSYGFKIIGDDDGKRTAPEKRWPDFSNW